MGNVPTAGSPRNLLRIAVMLLLAGLTGMPAADQSAVAGSSDPAPATSPTTWPQRSSVEGWNVTVYQPQPERLTGNVLTARAAIAIAQDEDEPVFGASWMTLRLDIDREQRTASVASVSVERVQFPSDQTGGLPAATITAHLAQALLAAGVVFTLDDLIATLEMEPDAETRYNLAPPRILIRTTPTELVVFDGEPRLESQGGVTLAVNTPAFVCVGTGGAWWLRLENGWLTAATLNGPWTYAPAPTAVSAAAEAAGLAITGAPADGAVPPDVIIAYEPTELVEFAGEPQWTPIGNTGLLAAENGDRDAFIDTATRRCWVLLAGRWFSAQHLTDEARWVAVAPDELPAAFAAIPADSRWAHVRVHVSGTEEARKATLDATVPQTARVPRSATITVTYDGEPRFVAIPASEAEWAENSSFAVFRTPGPRYWCCFEGVWYEASQADGPWSVASEIPGSLQNIPADNPHHNVTYVHIYESRPDYVWTGYTAGYLHYYTYRGCPIYGSGWYSRGYYGNTGYTCPRPLTWGVRVVFDPWRCGWGVSSGYRRAHSGSVVYVGNRTRGGWWGPTCHAPQPVYLPRSTTAALRDEARYRQGQQRVTMSTHHTSLYRRVPGTQVPTRVARPTPVGQDYAVTRDLREPVFVRNDGTLVRRAESGQWQERREQSWREVTPAERDQTHPEFARRLPRVATQPATPQRRTQQQAPRTPRPPQERPVEPPITRPTPPTDRPRPEPRERVEEPPRQRPEEPRRRPEENREQPPVTRPPVNEPPRQEPPRQRPEEPRRRPEENREQPPVTRPPTSEPPRQEPPRQRPEEPRRRPEENREQPPVTRPPTNEPPRQEPPRQRPEEPRRRPEENREQPPVTRPPANDRPRQEPPRTRVEEPRPERRPADQPTTGPQPPAEPPRTTPPDRRPERTPAERPANGNRPDVPSRSSPPVRPTPPPPPAERERPTRRSDVPAPGEQRRERERRERQ